MTGSKVRFFPASPMRNLSILGFVADTLCGSATGVVIMAVVQEMMLYCGRSCRVSLCTQFLLHQGHIERANWAEIQ